MKAESQNITEIEDQLRSALYQLQPEHLNIDADLDDATSVLNNWWKAIAAAQLMPEGLSAAAIPPERVSEELLTRLKRDSFDLDDGRYIRDCYLSRKISEQVAIDSPTEREHVMEVFEWVCRNVALRPLNEVNYPVSLYEGLILGRASSRDRAVILASILKQLRIDSVVFTLKNTSDEEAPWLFGAVLGNDVLLFDLQLGLPIPRGDVPVAERFQMAATLAELKAHPEWLEALSPRKDRPYGIRPADLSELQTHAVSFVEGWSPRMWTVEQLLPAEFLCVLYDAPASIDRLPGVFERVAAALPGTNASEILLWTYPADRMQQFYRPQVVELQALQRALEPMLCPVEYEPDKDGGQPRRVETLRQLRIRTDQLFGQRGNSISQYVTIRQLSVSRPPEPALGPLYQRAADDAFFWSCVCKYENGDIESAIDVLDDYNKRFRRSGQWGFEARSLLARAQHRLGKIEEAIQTLRIQESDDPYRDQHAILVQTWTESLPSATTPSDAATPSEQQ